MKNFKNDQDELHDWIDGLENLVLFNGKENASKLIKDFLAYVENKRNQSFGCTEN